MQTLTCTCRLFEFNLMSYPIGDEDTINIKCKASDDFTLRSCGIERTINPSKLRIDWTKDEIVRVVNVRMAYVNDSIRIETNFTSKMRVLFRQLNEINAPKRIGSALESKFQCLNINKSIGCLELSEIEEIDHANIISITVIPILYGFGAKPIHSMCVRREVVIDDWPWGYVILIAVTTGLFLGLATGSFIVTHKTFNAKARPHERKAADYESHEYAMPMNAIYTQPEPYVYDEMVERRRSDNYIEIIDTGYVAVLSTNNPNDFNTQNIRELMNEEKFED